MATYRHLGIAFLLIVALAGLPTVPSLAAGDALGALLVQAYIGEQNVSAECEMTLMNDEAFYQAEYSPLDDTLVVKANPGTYEVMVVYTGDATAMVFPVTEIITINTGETVRKPVRLDEMSFSDLMNGSEEEDDSDGDEDPSGQDKSLVKVRVGITAAGQSYLGAGPVLYQGDDYITELTRCEDGFYEGLAETGTYDVVLGGQILGMPKGFRIEGLEVTGGEPFETVVTLDTVHRLTVTPLVRGRLLRSSYVSIYRGDEFIECLVDTGDPEGFSALIYEGVYTLIAEPEDDRYVPAEIRDLPILSNVSIPLVLREKIPVRVSVTSGGKPYSHASVVATSGDEAYALHTTSQNPGLFEARIPEGTYQIEVRPGDSSLELKRLESVTVAGAPTDLAVEVGASGTLEVQVWGGGNIYGRARVNLSGADGNVISLIWDKNRGLYSKNVPAGTYGLTIEPQSYYQPQTIDRIEVQPNTAVRQEILLSRIGSPPPPVLTVHSAADLKDMASRYKQEYLGKLGLNERSRVEVELWKLDVDDSLRTKNALDLSSAAALLGGAEGYGHAAMVFASAAAEILPENPLVVSNFGSLLYALDQISDSISALYYGHNLDPKSDILLINLSNAFLAYGDDEQAEQFLLKALQIEENSSLVHRGLGTIYLERGDAQKALEHFFKAAQGMYTPTIRQGYDEAKAAGGRTTPSFGDAVTQSQAGASGPGEAGGPGNQGSSSESTPSSPGPSSGPESRLVIPDLPYWPTREGFLASRKDFARFYDVVGGAVLGAASDYVSGSSGSGPDYGSDEVRAKKALKHLWQLRCLQDYYLDRVMEEYDRLEDRTKTIDAEWVSEIAGLCSLASAKIATINGNMKAPHIDESMLNKDPTVAPVQQLEYWKKKFIEISEGLREVGRGIKEFDDLLHKLDEQAQAAGDRGFLQWRDAIHECYNNISVLLEEYWLYTDKIVTNTYDPQLTAQLNEIRRTFVYSGIFPACTDIWGRLIVYEFGPRIPTLSRDGVKEWEPPKSKPMDDPNVPDKEARECSEGTKSFGILVASVEWDCESVSFDFTEGFSGNVKINFRTRETTIFVGVGGGSKVGTNAAGGSLSAKAGGYITLDENFDVVDVGLKGSVGGGGSLAGAGGGAGADLTISLVTGPKIGAGTQTGFSTNLGVPD